MSRNIQGCGSMNGSAIKEMIKSVLLWVAARCSPSPLPHKDSRGNPVLPSFRHRRPPMSWPKCAIADVPILQHIQKELPGMNKLYAQSMCSEKQWRSYHKAGALVSAEVDEVRREADQVEPGWSQMIWRQAVRYHQVLKQRHNRRRAGSLSSS